MNDNDINNALLIALYDKIKLKLDCNLNEATRFAAELFEEISTIEGPIGPQGIRGDQGERGPAGPAGETGKQGLKGEKGQQGDPGPKGDTGERGPIGSQGDRGEQGDQGIAGPIGEKGDAGEPGPMGDRGEAGPAGAPGQKGPQGLKGDQGDVGPQGAEGKQGPQGPAGEKGQRGEKGAVGAIGPQGPAGEKGEKGDQGDQGDVGPQGPQGPAGKDAEIPDLTPHLDKVEKNFKRWQENVNKSLSTIGGGGSYSIMDNRDVVMKKRSEIEGESILVFNPEIQKFESESFLSVLERLKAELEVKTDRLIDEQPEGTYIGEAIPGTTKSSAGWRIKLLTTTPDSGREDLDIVWADGTADFVKVWDDRATYNYIVEA